MQQTEKYQLGLIEADDKFSPDALNKNTQKVESVLYNYMSGETTARVNADAALELRAEELESRVTTLEVHKIAIGTYTGTSQVRSISVGFAPKAVLVYQMNRVGQSHAFMVSGFSNSALHVNQNGFVVGSADSPHDMNGSSIKYIYLALA